MKHSLRKCFSCDHPTTKLLYGDNGKYMPACEAHYGGTAKTLIDSGAVVYLDVDSKKYQIIAVDVNGDGTCSVRLRRVAVDPQ